MKSILSLFCFFLAYSAIGQNNEGNFHIDKDYKLGATGTIKLSCSDAKVYITGSRRASAHVKIDREVTTKGLTFGHEEFTVNISEENGDLEIKEHSNSVSVGVVGYHYEKYTINIEAPEGSSLLVKGDDGDYWIKNIDGKISLNIDDADVELTACSGNDFSFRMDDGDLTMDEGKGRLEIDADDADVKISNAHFEKIVADFDDGDFIIETSLDDNGDYRITGQDGLVSMTITGGGGKFNVRHDDAHVNAEGKFEKLEVSEDRSKLRLAPGNANVDIRVDDGRVRLATK